MCVCSLRPASDLDDRKHQDPSELLHMLVTSHVLRMADKTAPTPVSADETRREHCAPCVRRYREIDPDGALPVEISRVTSSTELLLRLPSFKADVQQAIDSRYAGPTVYSAELQCANCAVFRGATVTLTAANSFVLCHVQRFYTLRDVDGARTIKLSDRVRVLPTIALPVDGVRIAYDLVGLVCHTGDSALVGHYVAVVKHDDHFILYDDNRSPTRFALEDADTTCFLLLYKRQLQ